jgi:hypothetical protein
MAPGSSDSARSSTPDAEIEKRAWRSFPPVSRATTQRSSVGEGSAFVTLSLPKVTCSCSPSGATRQSCRSPVTSAR